MTKSMATTLTLSAVALSILGYFLIRIDSLGYVWGAI